MRHRTLNPIEGLSTGIGFYLAGMEEVRDQVRETVQGMSEEQIGRPALSGAHAIGALLLHIGESEWWWMQCVLSGNKVTDEVCRAPYWDVLKDPAGFSEKGYSAEFCLDEITRIRQQTRETLALLDDPQLDRTFSFERDGQTYELSLRWILHHLVDHEAQHKGQILMLKRLQGLKNDGVFNEACLTNFGTSDQMSSTRSVGMNLARRFNAGIELLRSSSRSDD